jgi:capsular polysaccharide export protein
VVNSTTGHLGLELGVPVIALGPAVFNFPGMTFQDGLDRFWQEARPADLAWVKAFRSVVIERTQLNGGFFSKSGIKLAVANAVPRIEAVSRGLVALSQNDQPRVRPAAPKMNMPIGAGV